MRKKIDFPPYEEAEIKAVNDNGDVLCDLLGGQQELAPESGEVPVVRWTYTDSDILFPAGSPILSLTDEEIERFRDELRTREELWRNELENDDYGQ